MIKALVIVLLALPLVSFGPAPFPLDPAIVARHALTSVVTPRQSCDAAAARMTGTYLRQVVYDPSGAPYGEVAAWSCGDAEAAIGELRARQTALEAEAAAFRAAHPIGGAK